MSILIVFCLGLTKLWWTNRAVRKQEIIDEEKRTRLTEMRKTGLPTKRSNDIPFGIRAIQSGIEVDGIWISRPTTPSRSSSKSKMGLSTTTIIEIDENGHMEKNHPSEDSRSISGTTLGRPAAQRGHSGLSVMENSYSDAVDAQSTLSMPLPQISEDSALASDHRKTGRLNEEALRRLEGQTATRPPLLTTYIPTSRLASPTSSISRNHYRPGKRDSASSSESISSNGSSRNPSSSSSQGSFSTRAFALADGRLGYYTIPQGSPEKEGRAHEPPHSPIRFSTATSSTYLTNTSAESQVPLVASPQNLTMPQRTFGPGDTYANRATRKVNAGFEILPAGTFGSPLDLSRSSSGESRDEEEVHSSRLGRKLRKLSSHSLRQQL